MSDHIPFEIQVEIIKSLPIKSLIRFRSVSKPWRSFIDSSEFIADYKVHHSQPQRLLVSYRDPANYEVKCVLIDDDDSFPKRKCSLNVPLFIKSIKEPKIIGSSHGLLCLYGYYREGNHRYPDLGLRVIVLWNPSIQKSIVIKLPIEIRSPYKTVLGFGVCVKSNDPKLIKINCISSWANWGSLNCLPLQIAVFTISSRAWRIPHRNLPRKSICFQYSHTVIDGVIYWIACDRTNGDDNFKVYNLIISFALTSEEFREIYLPDGLAKNISSISKLRDSLVMLEFVATGMPAVYGIWMMEHGVPNSFTKLFTIGVPNAAFDPLLGFRENGEALLQTINTDKESVTVKVYEPSSQHIKDLGIYGEVDSSFMSSFNMETLILLDQPDSSILF